MFDAYVTNDLASKFQGRSLLHITDAAGVKAVMKVGSPVAELHNAALAVHAACRANNILLHEVEPFVSILHRAFPRPLS